MTTKRISLFILFLSVLLFYLKALPSAVNADGGATIWREDFENNLSSWEQTGALPNCKIEIQSVPPDKVSPAGGNNLLIYRAPKADECNLTRDINPVLENGRVSLWFYDNLEPANTMQIAAAVKDNQNHRMWLGVRVALNAQNYTYRVADDDTDTGVLRTKGWHLFEFYILNGKSFGVIDGQVIKAKGFSTRMRYFSQVKFFGRWRSKGAARFDGIDVVQFSLSNLLSTTVLGSQSTPQGSSKVKLETRIKSLTGSNYFQNVFLVLSEKDPQEGDTDIVPWFALIKDGSSFRFWGLKWQGTSDMAHPNIGKKDSYRWEVGGFLAGEEKVICNNTTRKASTSVISKSFACLELNDSSVFWDEQKKELVIQWRVNFLPNFINLRAIRRNLSIPSTGKRELKAYVNIDEPMRDYSTFHILFYGYNWQETSAFDVVDTSKQDFSPFVRISPGNGRGEKQRFTTTIVHPQNADLIKEVYLWFDEEPPTASRSDVAVTFGMIKTAKGWRFFGRNYKAGGNICPRDPFPLTAEDCYLNYAYDFGGVQLLADKTIFYNQDRSSSFELKINSTSFLEGKNSQVQIDSNDPKKLIINWSIGFLKPLGNRSFKSFVRWKTADGIISHWQEVGKWQLPNPPEFYQQDISIQTNPQNNQFVFSNGKVYTAVGIDHYLIHHLLTEEELDAYLAKMAMYHMNYLRIFNQPANPIPLAVKKLLELAEKHGVFVEFNVFGLDSCRRVARENNASLQGKEWIDWWIQLLGPRRSLFSWEICNDVEPYAVPWVKATASYVKQKDINKLVTVQLHTWNNYTEAPYLELKSVVDAYSIRAYGSLPEEVKNNLIRNFNKARNIQPQKPIYVGEFRLRPYAKFTSDGQEATVTRLVLEKGKELGITAVHPWIALFRMDYIEISKRGEFFPYLSSAEWRHFLTFPETINRYDLNNDQKTDFRDIRLNLKKYKVHDYYWGDLNADGMINGVDFGRIRKLVK